MTFSVTSLNLFFGGDICVCAPGYIDRPEVHTGIFFCYFPLALFLDRVEISLNLELTTLS